MLTAAGIRRVATSSPTTWPELLRYRWRLGRWRRLVRRGDRFALTSGSERYLVSLDDQLVGQLLFCMGEFEYDTFERARLVLGHPIRTLVDVGANVGSICIPAVARGAVERAHAIEPDPLNARLLAANTAINGVDDRVVIHACAAGAHDDEQLILELNEGNFADHRVGSHHGPRPGWRQVIVPSARLDGLCGPLDPATDLLWMDVQGYEAIVLQGAGEALASRVPLVMEFWPHGLDEQTGVGPLLDAVAGYRCWYDLTEPEPIARSLPELHALAERLRAAKEHVDILLV